MPRYSVSCSVHEATLAHRPGAPPSDLLLIMRCFGIERSTTIKTNKTNHACWDEVLHWNNLQLSTSDWDIGVLEFELQAANAYWRNDTLGMCSLQLKLVRKIQERCFSGRLPLTMPNSVRVTGHLSITVNVYDSVNGDTGNKLSLTGTTIEPESTEGLAPQIPSLMSPSVYKSEYVEDTKEEFNYYHLYVNIYTLEHLEVGLLGFSPYITVDYGSCHLQSAKPIRSRETEAESSPPKLTDKLVGFFFGTENDTKTRCNFTFNQCFLIPVRTAVGKPILEDNIIVRIWMGVEIDPTLSNAEKAPISPKIIADGVFSLAKLRARRQPPRWFNFYEHEASSSLAFTQEGGISSVAQHYKTNGAKNYIGRILMSASVKRLSKPSDVLHAHTLSSHQLEPPLANPTRLFTEAYCLQSCATFGFEGDFEVMLELSCGPYETATAWVPVRPHDDAPVSSDDSALFTTSTSSRSRSTNARKGWKATLDALNGRLPHLDLLASYCPEQQWLVFLRVKARGTINGRKQTHVIGSTSFPFERIPDSHNTAPSMPFWVALAAPLVLTLDLPSSDSSLFDPITMLDKVTSDARKLVNDAIAMDPTGLIEMAANSTIGTTEAQEPQPPPRKPTGLSFFDPLRQKNGEEPIETTKNPKYMKRDLESNRKRRAQTDCHDVKGSKPTPGDTCDVGTTVNVLLSLQKHCFYSDMSANISMGNDIRNASHPRRASMIRMEYELRCYIYCSKLSCYPGSKVAVTIACDSNFGRTQVQRNFTLFPVFAECCVLQVSIPTSSSGGIPSPVPITVSLVFFDRKRRLVRCESAVTTYHRLVKSGSNLDKYDTPSPVWLQLSGCSEVLLFTELIPRTEASKVPKNQMSPLMAKCQVKLGIIGIRNLDLPPGHKIDGLLIKLAMQSFGVNVDREQSVERIYHVGDSQWERGGKVNFDLFTVQPHAFDIPQDPIYDPHVEFICQAIYKGEVGPVIGYQSFPCYPEAKVTKALPRALDLRYALNPNKITTRLYELVLKPSQNVLMLGEPQQKGKTTRMMDGMPDILSKFEASRHHARLLRSMDAFHIGVQVPSKLVLACDGRKVPSKSVVGYVAVASDILDKMLTDVPFSISSLDCQGSRQHQTSKGSNTGSGRNSIISGTKLTSIPGNARNGKLNNTRSRQHFIETSNVAVMKYFMTMQHGKSGAVYRSYPEVMAIPATNSEKMQRAFRSCLKNKMFKLRFCVVSANNIVPDTETVGSPFLVVGISKSEYREPLPCDSGAIHGTVHRTWEQDIFLPEDSQIRLTVMNTVERFDGGLDEQPMASAQIDLENRWYSKCWQRMLRKDTLPIERIVLRDRDNNVHGSLSVIVQLGPMELFSTLKPLKFNKSTHSVTEVRLVIWSTKGVRMPSTAADAKKKDQLDLYVVSTLDCQGYKGEHPSEQRTDTHYNCDSGAAQFNWRVVYPDIQAPVGACQLQLSVYDFWKVGAPVFVGELNLELKNYVNIVSSTSNRIQLSGELPLVNSSSSLPVGTVNVTLQVITRNESSCFPVGLGRNEPNARPYLPAPHLGRQWNDWFAHTVVSFDFGAISIYIKGVVCTLLLLWLFFISFIYPALLM